MSQVFKRGVAKAEMNMTPLIDITFQLIIFFILTMNIASQETVPMIVPELEDPKTQIVTDDRRLVVNISPQPFGPEREREGGTPLAHDGMPSLIRVGQNDYRIEQVEEVTRELVAYRERIKAADATAEPLVLLRADGAIYYEGIAPIMNAIAAAGIEKINLVALLPEK